MLNVVMFTSFYPHLIIDRGDKSSSNFNPKLCHQQVKMAATKRSNKGTQGKEGGVNVARDNWARVLTLHEGHHGVKEDGAGKPRAVSKKLKAADEKKLPAIAAVEESEERDPGHLVRCRHRIKLL